MWTDLWSALALVLVLEGLLPTLSPRGYRKAMLAVIQMDERAVRVTGMASMIIGALLLYLVKNG